LIVNRTAEEKLNEIIKLMKERDYDPVAQLTGYIGTGSDDYITRHGGARDKKRSSDRCYKRISGIKFNNARQLMIFIILNYSADKMYSFWYTQNDKIMKG